MAPVEKRRSFVRLRKFMQVRVSWPARGAQTGRPVRQLQPCMATGRWHKTRPIADGSSGSALTPAWKLVACEATCALDPAQNEFALLSWSLLLEQKPQCISLRSGNNTNLLLNGHSPHDPA